MLFSYYEMCVEKKARSTYGVEKEVIISTRIEQISYLEELINEQNIIEPVTNSQGRIPAS